MTQLDKGSEDFKTLDDKIDTVILESRRVFLSDSVDNVTACDVIRKIWYLELIDPSKPITLIINSPGGSVDAGFSIWDQVKMISSPIITLVTGLAASMGSVLSLCASPGKRFITKNARVMIHQPSISGSMVGQATDLYIQAQEIAKTKQLLIDLYATLTGHRKEVIAKAIERDTWMNAQEALDFGLFDKIVSSYQEVE